MKTNNSLIIQNLKHQRNFEEKLITISKNISVISNKIIKTAKKKKNQTENEALHKDLKENILKTKQLQFDPEKTFQDLLYQYGKKCYYNKSQFDLDNNIFAVNPLLDKERAIIEHYNTKFNEIGFTENIETFEDKSKCYLQNLNESINQLNKKNTLIKPDIKKSRKSVSHHSSMNNMEYQLTNKELKKKNWMINENKKLILYNKTISAIINEETPATNYVYNRNKTSSWFEKMPHHKIFRRSHANHQTITTSTDESITISGNNPLMMPNPKKQTKKQSRLISNMKLRTLARPNWSFTQYQTEPVPLTKEDLLRREIIEKPKHEIINTLYQFTKETDYQNYKKLLVQYANKYKKHSQLTHNTLSNMTSQTFVPYLNQQFNHLKNIIEYYNEREKSINCYSKIGKADNTSDKIIKLVKLDKTLSKFHYSFVKRTIINEKRD